MNLGQEWEAEVEVEEWRRFALYGHSSLYRLDPSEVPR